MVERSLDKMTAELQEWESELQGELDAARRKFDEETKGITEKLARVRDLIRAASGKGIRSEPANQTDGQKKKRNRKPIPPGSLLSEEELRPILASVLKADDNLSEKEIVSRVTARAKDMGKATVGLHFRVKAALKAKKKY